MIFLYAAILATDFMSMSKGSLNRKHNRCQTPSSSFQIFRRRKLNLSASQIFARRRKMNASACQATEKKDHSTCQRGFINTCSSSNTPAKMEIKSSKRLKLNRCRNCREKKKTKLTQGSFMNACTVGVMRGLLELLFAQMMRPVIVKGLVLS